jgi:3-deoxy-7-phosphoheptulonate synthase
MPGSQATAIGITGNTGPIPVERFRGLAGIAKLVPVSEPYKLVSRNMRPEGTRFVINGVTVGGPELMIIAGPCSVESRAQILEVAHAVKAAGARFLRGGAYKPRTSPYAFQGLKLEGLELLAEAKAATGLGIVTEVKDTETLAAVAEHADVLQIGARNMQNFSLLEAVGRQTKPVLLKRGMSATIKELLMAAEYVVSGGNHQVILCERGIRTFETTTRNTFDVGAISVLKRLTHLPVIGDPSHGIGLAPDVPAMSRAAIAAGADGLIVEVHPDPKAALSDGDQSLRPEVFAQLMQQVRGIAAVLGRTVV